MESLAISQVRSLSCWLKNGLKDVGCVILSGQIEKKERLGIMIDACSVLDPCSFGEAFKMRMHGTTITEERICGVGISGVNGKLQVKQALGSIFFHQKNVPNAEL